MTENYKEKFIHQLEYLLDDWADWVKTTEIVMNKETVKQLLASLKKHDSLNEIQVEKRVVEKWANRLYDSMPSGDIDAWKMIKTMTALHKEMQEELEHLHNVETMWAMDDAIKKDKTLEKRMDNSEGGNQ